MNDQKTQLRIALGRIDAGLRVVREGAELLRKWYYELPISSRIGWNYNAVLEFLMAVKNIECGEQDLIVELGREVVLDDEA